MPPVEVSVTTKLACSSCGALIQPPTAARTGGLCMPCFACQPRTPTERKAWLRGERVSGIKLLYNQRVRVTAGADAGAFGWIVAVDIRSKPEPIYTVEIENGRMSQELAESALEPAS